MKDNDEAIGTAVLTADDRGREYLFLNVCSYERKYLSSCAIPVRPKGQPHPIGSNWEYEVQGNMLVVTPSLKISGGKDLAEELFHNTGRWLVEFVRSDIDKASDVSHEINRELRDSIRAKWAIR